MEGCDRSEGCAVVGDGYSQRYHAIYLTFADTTWELYIEMRTKPGARYQ